MWFLVELGCLRFDYLKFVNRRSKRGGSTDLGDEEVSFIGTHDLPGTDQDFCEASTSQLDKDRWEVLQRAAHPAAVCFVRRYRSIDNFTVIFFGIGLPSGRSVLADLRSSGRPFPKSARALRRSVSRGHPGSMG